MHNFNEKLKRYKIRGHALIWIFVPKLDLCYFLGGEYRFRNEELKTNWFSWIRYMISTLPFEHMSHFIISPIFAYSSLQIAVCAPYDSSKLYTVFENYFYCLIWIFCENSNFSPLKIMVFSAKVNPNYDMRLFGFFSNIVIYVTLWLDEFSESVSQSLKNV